MSKKDFILKLNDYYNQGNIEGLLANFTDDIKWEIVGSPPMIGKEDVEKGMRMEDFTGPPVVTISETIEEGDRIVVDGIVKMLKKDGGLHTAAYCDIYHFVSDKVSMIKSYVVDFPENYP